ncbi:ABC transporter ATP-binding protein [Mycoplasma procyoni]|uniref:ABC transporter ATP-binding protein n=1 Tax=Mycoplasma procyoni TaxID=568784 RepID=UPI00197B9931|nr:ABC transporter ATP-binding protein [Mycoplasma procyoni]MBN3534724.1 ABC transporter ATP-binding protein [Mycoplasma procyoni]
MQKENQKTLIELIKVDKEFGEKKVLNNVNLQIKKGDFVTLLGPSGSGKTTILRLIGGFEWTTRGEIKFDGLDIKDLPANKRDVSTIFQDYALFQHLTVSGNIKYGLKLKRYPKNDVKQEVLDKLESLKIEWSKHAQQKMQELDKQQKEYKDELNNTSLSSRKKVKIQKWLDDSDFKYSYWENYTNSKVEHYTKRHLTRKITKQEMEQEVKEMIQLVGLEGNENKNINELSGGMRQRVALARSLVIEPEILLLDEPLSALDAKIRQKMQQLLRSVQQKLGLTFVFVTHDQKEALELSDKIAVIRDGEIEQYDSPTHIYDYPVNKWVANFIGDSNFFDVEFIEPGKAKIMNHIVETIHTEFANGEKVDGLIRPEDMILSRTQKGHYFGKVVNSTYKGSYYFIEVEVGDKNILVETIENFEIGEEVYVHWTKSSLHLMKKDRKGF